ncbi:MAG: cytochrome c family protein [Planctomycetes bacterium]|nr:cytochrome c family protein [Planctomycetota bacterium]
MKIRWILAALLASGFVLIILLGTLSQDAGADKAPRTFIRSEECRECHPEVYAEWESSWHARAWADPFVREKQMADNFKKKDCIPCHAPRPIFERGIVAGQRVVERASYREDGVDCLSCHRLPEGGFAASSQGAQGPCQPVYHPLLTDPALCAPCHNQHKTVDEWEAAPASLKGDDCNGCHMPEAVRTDPKTGRTRPGRDHMFYGGHSPQYLKEAFSFEYQLSGDRDDNKLSARIINDRCGHNLPTDSRHRALDLVITFFKEGGLPYPAADADREFGQEPGTHRMRFRNPYRTETGKIDTQIPAGETRELTVPVPEAAARARIQVIYKLKPFMNDDEGHELVSEEISLRQGQP